MMIFVSRTGNIFSLIWTEVLAYYILSRFPYSFSKGEKMANRKLEMIKIQIMIKMRKERRIEQNTAIIIQN